MKERKGPGRGRVTDYRWTPLVLDVARCDPESAFLVSMSLERISRQIGDAEPSVSSRQIIEVGQLAPPAGQPEIFRSGGWCCVRQVEITASHGHPVEPAWRERPGGTVIRQSPYQVFVEDVAAQDVPVNEHRTFSGAAWFETVAPVHVGPPVVSVALEVYLMWMTNELTDGRQLKLHTLRAPTATLSTNRSKVFGIPNDPAQ